MMTLKQEVRSARSIEHLIDIRDECNSIIDDEILKRFNFKPLADLFGRASVKADKFQPGDAVTVMWDDLRVDGVIMCKVAKEANAIAASVLGNEGVLVHYVVVTEDEITDGNINVFCENFLVKI